MLIIINNGFKIHFGSPAIDSINTICPAPISSWPKRRDCRHPVCILRVCLIQHFLVGFLKVGLLDNPDIFL